jgi:4-amino-4-deoxy-L-arabinose transferase-like glycosyltransferase
VCYVPGVIADDHSPDAASASFPSWLRRHRVEIALAAFAVVTLLPFIAKPFNIDDTFYLAVAKHIVTEPFDFYGFAFNWYGTLEPVTYANHAPTTAYYMALVGLVFGWSEVAMHAAFMVPAAAFVLGTYALARRWSEQPLLAALTAWFCPAVFVSATSVMTDVWMGACFVVAMALWVAGIEESKRRLVIAASIFAALAGLMKFFGVTVVGLMAVYAIGKRYPVRIWLPLVGFPVLVLVGYELLTQAMYGQGLVSGAFDFAGEGRERFSQAWYRWLVVGLSFTGGGLLAGAFTMLVSARRAVAIGVVVVVLGLTVVFSRWPIAPGSDESDWVGAVHLAVFVVLGGLVVGFSARQLWVERNLAVAVLILWAAGTLVFSVFVNWSVTARTFVPMAPAVAMLAFRSGGLIARPAGVQYAAVAVSAAIALCVAWGDMDWSRSVRVTAREMNESFRGAPVAVYYQGHWGFQYYADPDVMQALDVERTKLNPGDYVITPVNNSVYPLLEKDYVAYREALQRGGGRWVNTMLGPSGAGFYSSLFGPLPFRLGPGAPETYFVTQVGPSIVNRGEVIVP